MLHASSSNPSAALFNRQTYPRSASYSFSTDDHDGPPADGGNGNGNGTQDIDNSVNGEESDVRRSKSLRTPGLFGGMSGSRILDARKDVAGLPSFATAGSNLTSPALSASSHYTPPAASRHPLFSHHAAPSISGMPYSQSPTVFSDPGPAETPSPTISSSGFSPASAFLSHFATSRANNPAPVLAPDAQGARVLDYTLGKIIGRGGFSTVRLATHTNGEVFACKIVKRDDLSDSSGSVEKFEEEITTWQNLPRHPSLLPLLEMHRKDNTTFFIMPYMSGGSLLDVLKNDHGSEQTARKWFPGVVAAVAALHEGFGDFKGGILHGDLKLDNFLVDPNGSIMVCDFYMAQKVGITQDHPTFTIPPPLGRHRGGRMSSPFPKTAQRREDSPAAQTFPSASLPYAPPELLRPPPSPPHLAQDIWAVGVILYALLTDRLPFVDAFDPRLQLKILRGTWEVPSVGREWVECLQGCLDGNVETRWDIQRVRECDAVVGWQEVKSRSKSRSRSRMRGKGDFRRSSNASSTMPTSPVDIMDRRGRKGFPSPMPTRRDPSRGALHPDTASAYHPHNKGYEDHASVFMDSSRSRSASLSARATASGSGSGSNSRSRSTGRKNLWKMSPDIQMAHLPDPLGKDEDEEMANAVEGINITRGRSTATKLDTTGLTYNRSPGALNLPKAASRSRSSNRRQPVPIPLQPYTPSLIQPFSAPPRPTIDTSRSDSVTRNRASSSSTPTIEKQYGFRPSSSNLQLVNLIPNDHDEPSNLTSGSPLAAPPRSTSEDRISRSGSQTHLGGTSSPSISRRSGSRSRNSPGDGGWHGGELEVLDEEGTWRVDREKEKDRSRGRSRQVVGDYAGALGRDRRSGSGGRIGDGDGDGDGIGVGDAGGGLGMSLGLSTAGFGSGSGSGSRGRSRDASRSRTRWRDNFGTGD